MDSAHIASFRTAFDADPSDRPRLRRPTLSVPIIATLHGGATCRVVVRGSNSQNPLLVQIIGVQEPIGNTHADMDDVCLDRLVSSEGRLAFKHHGRPGHWMKKRKSVRV